LDHFGYAAKLRRNNEVFRQVIICAVTGFEAAGGRVISSFFKALPESWLAIGARQARLSPEHQSRLLKNPEYFCNREYVRITHGVYRAFSLL